MRNIFFDENHNKDRNRHYGLRIGDRIKIEISGLPTREGDVVGFSLTDNNKAYIKYDDGKIVGWVAEWCTIIEKVEDRASETQQ